MKMMKRGFALLLALVLVAGYVPVRAEAKTVTAADEWLECQSLNVVPTDSEDDGFVWIRESYDDTSTPSCGIEAHEHTEACYEYYRWSKHVDSNNNGEADWLEKIKVTFETNGGTLPETITNPYETNAYRSEWENLMQTTTAPTKVGYCFTGWYVDETLQTKVLDQYQTPPVGEYAFYAGWMLNAPQVELAYNGQTLTANAVHEANGVTYTYAWSKDDEAVEGTSKQLEVSELGNYSVAVTAVLGTITSDVAQASIAVDHIHDWGYSARDNVITATCKDDDTHVQTATVTAPVATTYSGTDILASVVYSDEWPGGTLELTHSGDTINVTTEGVTAKITREDLEASVCYTISPLSMENLKVESESSVYDGLAHSPEFYIGAYKLVLNQDYTLGEWNGNLTDVGEYSVTITGIGNYTGETSVYHKITPAYPTAELFDVTLPENAIYEENKTHEAMVSVKDSVEGLGVFTVKYNGSSDKPEEAGEYEITVDVDEGSNYGQARGLSLQRLSISGAAQEAPTGLGTVKETILNMGDGKITGVTAAMEYKRKDSEDGFAAIEAGDIKEGAITVASGTYLVRYAADDNYNASDAVEVTVAAGNALKVTVPAKQVGYTLTLDKAEVGYNGEVVITFALAEGYSRTDAFKVKVAGKEVTLENDGTYKITGITADTAVTVEGVADTTAPTIKVTLDKGTEATTDDVITTDLMGKSEVKFEEYWGIGAKVAVAQTSTGGSDVTILYRESSTAMSAEELDKIKAEEWETYTKAVTPTGDGNKIFYFKAVDAAGNKSYASTQGFIYDGTVPAFSLAEGTYGITKRVTVSDANLLSIEINDNSQEIKGRTTITYRMEKNTTTTTDDQTMTYKYVVTDKAGNTSEAIYTIEEMKYETKGTSWSQGSTKTLDFKVNAVLSDVDENTYNMKFKVLVDSKEVASTNYTLEEATDGSGTTIKLKTTYLKTLTVKKHTIQVSVVSGTTTVDSTEAAEFTVSNNPATGDDMDMALWGGMAAMSLMLAAAVLVLGKKRFSA